MASLRWTRDCWSLFVTNLGPSVLVNDLYSHFREAGFVFDVFIPRNKQNGKSRVCICSIQNRVGCCESHQTITRKIDWWKEYQYPDG